MGEENLMGTKSEALAKQFEVKVQDAIATLEKLSEADWKKVTEAEKWPVPGSRWASRTK